eukprot:jgi/Mesen1/3508/ME000197S02527
MKKHEARFSIGTTIQELPDDILTLILESSWQGLGNKRQAVGRQRGVCKRWKKLVNCSAKDVYLEEVSKDAVGTLQALEAFTNVTQVRLQFSGRPNENALLQGLATGFPRVRAFDIRFIHGGMGAFSGLFHFLSHRTSLEELSLTFSSFEYTNRLCRGLMEQVEFSSLVHLKTLTLRYGNIRIWKARDHLPLSRSILGLPQLQAFHLHVYDICHLPPWLGELRAFASLSVDGILCEAQGLKPFNPAPFRTLQTLELLSVWQLHRRVLAALVKRLPALTSLQLNRYPKFPESYAGAPTMGDLLLRPGLRRLHLAAQEIPPVRRPLAELADLWLRVSRQASLQRDLFAFMPALQHLHLELLRADSWPDFCRLPAQLTSLTVRTRLKAAVGVSTQYDTRFFCCRFFKRYRQYEGDAHPCRFMPPGMARQLFPDAGPLSPPPAGPKAPVQHVACSAARQPDTALKQPQQQQQQEEGAEVEHQQQEEVGTPQHAGLPPPHRLSVVAAAATATPGPRDARRLAGALKAVVEDLHGAAKGACGGTARALLGAAELVEKAHRLLAAAAAAGTAPGSAGGNKGTQARPRARRHLAAKLQSRSPRAPAAGAGSSSSSAKKREREEAAPSPRARDARLAACRPLRPRHVAWAPSTCQSL